MLDPSSYQGAYGALNQQVDDYIGRVQLNDILGVGQEGDYLACEAEYGGMPIPLGQLSAMDSGMGMGAMPPAPMPSDPMESDTARREMTDLLASRAQSRDEASARWQAQARQMTGV